nr:hypothetical protein [Tanacetum cinerariifolium]
LANLALQVGWGSGQEAIPTDSGQVAVRVARFEVSCSVDTLRYYQLWQQMVLGKQHVVVGKLKEVHMMVVEYKVVVKQQLVLMDCIVICSLNKMVLDSKYLHSIQVDHEIQLS